MAKLTSKKKIEFDILYSSLIGTEIEIIDSKNKLQIGIKGILVYESSKLLILKNIQNNKNIQNIQNSENNKFNKNKKEFIKILKKNVKIKFVFEGKPLNMDACLLLFTITNRIKKIK